MEANSQAEVETNSQTKPVTKRPKYRAIVRDQGVFTNLFIEDLIDAHHPARMIWEITGQLNLSAFDQEADSFEHEAGRARWPPRLLVSVLAYGYTLGTGSARQLERMMEHEPGLRWLVALDPVNHHTLSDFRTQELERLKGILSQVLAVLAGEELVDFQTLLQDGTKMRAQAGKESFRRRKTLSEHLAEAQACVKELDRRAAQDGEGAAQRSKSEAARERAARERLARMEAALRELEKREAAARPSQRAEVRVSESEPEARKMKHADGSYAPSYNLQLVTEAEQGLIVGWSVSASPNDQHELLPGLEMAVSSTQQAAQTMIADGGYASRANIEAMAERGVVLVAPRTEEEKRQAGAMARAGIAPAFAAAKFTLAADEQAMQCPAGAVLVQIKERKHHGQAVRVYQAEAAVCGACPHQPQCCPQREARQVERVIESEAVQEHDRRMAEPATQELYKKRKQIAEYANMRIKSDWGLDQFRLRGLEKVTKEAFWMVLAFTLDRWHSLRRRKTLLGEPAAA